MTAKCVICGVFQAEVCPSCARPERRGQGPTLVDCGCEAKVYADGSGIEIVYCPMHQAAKQMLEALRGIAKGEGRFSLDPLTHASNTIEDMKAIAVAAIDTAEIDNEPEQFCPACDAGVGYCNGPHKGTTGEVPY